MLEIDWNFTTTNINGWIWPKYIDLRKQDFLSAEKVSERFCFVNKYVMQSWFNTNYYL